MVLLHLSAVRRQLPLLLLVLVLEHISVTSTRTEATIMGSGALEPPSVVGIHGPASLAVGFIHGLQGSGDHALQRRTICLINPGLVSPPPPPPVEPLELRTTIPCDIISNLSSLRSGSVTSHTSRCVATDSELLRFSAPACFPVHSPIVPPQSAPLHQLYSLLSGESETSIMLAIGDFLLNRKAIQKDSCSR